jgi:hypothetical protein
MWMWVRVDAMCAWWLLVVMLLVVIMPFDGTDYRTVLPETGGKHTTYTITVQRSSAALPLTVNHRYSELLKLKDAIKVGARCEVRGVVN